VTTADIKERRSLDTTGALDKASPATSVTDGADPLRDAAVAAARRGWHVFPCRPGDKRPAVDRWEQRACADPERVGRYWPARHNVGIACGPSRLLVLDLDTHGMLPDEWRLPGIRDGRDVLAQLAEWAGQDWPSTYTVSTPSSGWHLYFTAPEGSELRNTAGKLGPLIDTRGCGGYVLAVGSVVDGRRYEVLDEDGPRSLPGWLYRLLLPEQPKNVVAPRPDNVVAPERARARAQALIDSVLAGQPGDRNGLLHWASCRAAEMVAAGEADQDSITEALVSAAIASGLRGGEREARRTVASGMRSVGR
jgi:Bifunctional DNA primase/polymerase, N-terminal